MANQDILGRNNVKVVGGGASTVVLAHSLGCDQNVWRYVAPELAKSCRVVLFDYVGSGRSDRAAYDPVRYGSLNGYVTDLLEVLEATADDPVTLVGHSVSGSIGIRAAVKAPQRFERLALVSPNPFFVNADGWIGGLNRSEVDEFLQLMDQNFMGWATTFASVVALEEDVRRELTESFCSTDPRTLRRFAEIALLTDVRSELAQVTTRSLILQCTQDGVAPPSVGEFMARQMPHTTLRMLDAAGHCPHLSHPALVAEALVDFLAGP
jgi:sigma-B regulation protein RsbQ